MQWLRIHDENQSGQKLAEAAAGGESTGAQSALRAAAKLGENRHINGGWHAAIENGGWRR